MMPIELEALRRDLGVHDDLQTPEKCRSLRPSGDLVATIFTSRERGLDELLRERVGALLVSRRFQFIGAFLAAAFVPFLVQLANPPLGPDPAKTNALAANTLAVIIAFWMRLSITVYPGIRRSYIIVPTVLTAHAITYAALLASRLPYPRISLAVSVVLHVAWLYLLFVAVERRARRRIAVVPSGSAEKLLRVPNIDWVALKRPRLADARGCSAIAADFSDLPAEWEAFLAEAAIAGRIVYQHKQLSESLTGRVELEHLSENTFGSLLPSRGYFHVKGLIDFLAAAAALPLLLPLMGLIASAIAMEGSGSVLFRQRRVGHGGREFTVYKFRTMRALELDDGRVAATTLAEDDRVTRVGRVLRKYRLDELPQIINILRWEMSWIGPRPEAKILSLWYNSEIPYYLYRHVVKPGISGWAQVNQGHVASIDDVHVKLQFDFYYIKHFSPWLDLLIVLRTLKTVVTGFGSK
jgi:lipopolysaccharide/colanic/teichoic acid biosynthesis glycosyltransferase